MNHRTHLTALALIGTLLGAGCAAGAQSASNGTGPDNAAPAAPAAHGRMHGGLLGRAMAGLDLTDDQKARIKDARMKFRASRQTSTPETREQYMADVESSMTADQKTRFESNLRSLRAQMRADRNNGTNQPPAGNAPQ